MDYNTFFHYVYVCLNANIKIATEMFFFTLNTTISGKISIASLRMALKILEMNEDM